MDPEHHGQANCQTKRQHLVNRLRDRAHDCYQHSRSQAGSIDIFPIDEVFSPIGVLAFRDDNLIRGRRTNALSPSPNDHIGAAIMATNKAYSGMALGVLSIG